MEIIEACMYSYIVVSYIVSYIMPFPPEHYNNVSLAL